MRRALEGLFCIGIVLGGAEAVAQSSPASPAAPPAATPSTGSPPNGSAASTAAQGEAPTSATASQPVAPSTADVLFEEGRALLKQNAFDAACAKLEASQKLDPAAKTLFNLATCEEGRGRFGTATRRWKEALALLAADYPQRTTVEEHMAAAEKRAGHLVLRFSGAVLGGTTITLDEQVLTAAELGVAIVVDVGAHRVVVSAPGHESRAIPITATAETTPEVVLMLGPPTVPPTAPRPVVPPPVAAPMAVVSNALSVSLSRHKASFLMLGGGVVLAGAGVGVSADILGRYHSFVQKCVSATGCTRGDKSGMANEAVAVDVLFAVAGATGAAAIGVFMFAEDGLSSAPQPQVGLSLGPTGASISVPF